MDELDDIAVKVFNRCIEDGAISVSVAWSPAGICTSTQGSGIAIPDVQAIVGREGDVSWGDSFPV